MRERSNARAIDGVGGGDRRAKLSRLGSKATPATKALERAKVPVKTHAYAHDPQARAFGLEAVEALGLDPATVFKTLVADVDGTVHRRDRPGPSASST